MPHLCRATPSTRRSFRGAAGGHHGRVPYLLPDAPIADLDEYVARGGGEGLRAARALGSDGIIDELGAAGLRGRGGGGFPTGTKWRSVRDAGGGRRHVVANG